MKRVLLLTDEAQYDLDEAVVWYERRSKKLAERLMLEVRTVLLRVDAEPEFFGVIRRGVRRAATKRFPYAVFYRFDERRIEVVAILHNRRAASVWQSRL